MKCTICGENIEESFMGKIKGTYVKGKPVCAACQKEGGDKELKGVEIKLNKIK